MCSAMIREPQAKINQRKKGLFFPFKPTFHENLSRIFKNPDMVKLRLTLIPL
jgi:hypothetical protein